MKNLDLAAFVKDLDKLFNDMQDGAVDGSALVITAARVIENQAKEIESLKDKVMLARQSLEIVEEWTK